MLYVLGYVALVTATTGLPLGVWAELGTRVIRLER